ncbi:MAG: DUF945 domain-containing protein [Desulfobacterales bacterium]|nr:DUF945 domain-containing protein [Desulfobacterales bacterium]
MLRTTQLRSFNKRNQTTELSNSELIELVPAIGATEAHKDVSDKYSFLPTIEIVDSLRDYGFVPIMVNGANVRKKDKVGFAKHEIRFLKKGLEIADGERLDISVINSHDRGSSVILTGSVWRKICGNGLMVPSELFNYSHRHVNFSMEEFLNSTERIVENASVIADEVDNYKNIELTQQERSIFAESAKIDLLDGSNFDMDSNQLLRHKRYDDNGNDLWTTFNVVQEHIVEGSYRKKNKETNKTTKAKAIKNIDRNQKVNKGLWNLTTKMAELKKAA